MIYINRQDIAPVVLFMTKPNPSEPIQWPFYEEPSKLEKFLMKLLNNDTKTITSKEAFEEAVADGTIDEAGLYGVLITRGTRDYEIYALHKV